MRLKRIMIGALVAGSLLGSAVGVGAAADLNNNGSNCHGVVISQITANFESPGQIQKDLGVPAKDLQGLVQQICSSI